MPIDNKTHQLREQLLSRTVNMAQAAMPVLIHDSVPKTYSPDRQRASKWNGYKVPMH